MPATMSAALPPSFSGWMICPARVDASLPAHRAAAAPPADAFPFAQREPLLYVLIATLAPAIPIFCAVKRLISISIHAKTNVVIWEPRLASHPDDPEIAVKAPIPICESRNIMLRYKKNAAAGA